MDRAAETGVLVLAVAIYVGMSIPAVGQTNLAIDRPYTLVPAPGYAHCTDEGDLEQLTDGRRVGPEQFWVQEGCVGWKLPVDGEADVVIDLGAVHPIDAIRYHAASGPNADVYFPSATLAVSDAGEAFHVVASIDTRDQPQRGRRWFAAEGLHTRGRFVLVRLHANGVYAFLDEIEVLAGEHATDDARLPDETIEPLVEEPTETPLQRRLRRDLAGMRARLVVSDAPQQARLLGRIDDLEPPIADLDETTGEPAEAVEAAVSHLHKDVVRALRGDAAVVCWVAEPYGPLSPRDLQPRDHESAVELILPRNAHASAAVNIQNLTDEAVEVPVTLEGLDGLVRLREARFIATRQGNLLADALPLLDDGTITVPPRETRQVWLSLASGEAPRGTYSGALDLPGVSPQRVPVTLTVTDARIPDDLPYATYSWQYPDTWPAIQEHLDEALADLHAHHTTVTILSASSVPWPAEVDAEGNMTAPMDFARHDEMVELVRPFSPHGIAWFPNFAHSRQGFDQFEWMDERWKRLFTGWLRAWVAHLQELGVGYDQFIFYPLDESIDEQYVQIARLTREVDPRVRLFADPLARDSDERLREALPLVDIWCPNLPLYERRPWQLDMIRGTGATMWSYVVGRREADPYERYRLHHWRARRDGATGAGFWAYAQGGDWRDEDLWDDFTGGGSDYGVIYTLTGAPDDISRAEAIIPGKRWEAWREGVEDWLCMWLFDRALEARNDADEQRAWLANTVAAVPAEPQEAGRAARARAEVLRRMAAW